MGGSCTKPGVAMDEPCQIASDVYCLGPYGRTQTNVYFVRSDTSWLLVDAGWESDHDRIHRAAEQLFGIGFRPAAILLTHAHPDHDGAARSLAHAWACRVYIHADERAIACGDFHAMWRHAGPLDRYLILPAITAMGPKRRDAMLVRNSLRDVVEVLPSDGAVPHLPDWRWINTPGHTPGHVAYVRSNDRLIISGDALVTLCVNSPAGMLGGRQGLSEPPWYTTPDRGLARTSIAAIAELEPRILAGGHGRPLTAPDTPERIKAFARSLRRRARIETSHARAPASAASTRQNRVDGAS
jgi:glyoxylase-like metal-dependent hydrolase (beta-lactamase superfamily II)